MDPDPSSSPALPGLRGLLADAFPLALLGPVELAVYLGALALLLGLSALFSGSEVALFSISPAEREVLATDARPRARRLRWMLEHPRAVLLSIFILTTIANVGAAILATGLALETAAAHGLNETMALVATVAVLAFVLLVVGAIVPKVVAARQPVAFGRRAGVLLYPLVRALNPVSQRLARAMLWLQERLHRPSEPLSTEDLKTLAELDEEHGALEENERALIHSILEFGETTVREVMVSRVDVLALPETATLDEALALIRASGHSRFPLYRDHLDRVLGVVYAKDLLPYLSNGRRAEPPVWAELARQPRFVPLSKPLDDMLADFQAHNTHMAIVVDEYGGTAGLVTLEDLLEEVVGEIRDELDETEEPLVQLVAPDTWRAEARIDLDDLADVVGVALDTDEFDFETLGGLIFHLAGEIPLPGDEVTYERLRLRVEGMEQNRIKDVLVTLLPEPEAADLAGSRTADER